MTALLKVKDLVAGYQSHDVLKKIQLLVDEQMFIGILGPNGSGKSTFLQVLARSLKVKFGSVLINGMDLNDLPFREFGRAVGYVPQENSIPFSYSVYDIVMMGRNPHIPRFRAPGVEDEKAVANALKQTGVMEFADRSITSLSGGERQRVLIARALAQDAELLLLDEPFAHIDLHHQYELISLIRESVRGKKAAIGVFHDINLAAAYCDHLLLLYEGGVRAFGSPHDVLTKENLEDVFKIKPFLGENPVTGVPFVFVMDEERVPRASDQVIVLISGAGSGACLMKALNNTGYRVRCGVLSEQDSDYQVAMSLGLEVISEPPFSRISLEHEEELIDLVSKADRAIVTAVPIGWGNYPNIRALERIHAEKVILYLPESGNHIMDYTGGAATTLLNHLTEQGAVRAHSIGEVVSLLEMVSDSGSCVL
ncbi:MAG: ABC transporter ATP-binding protein [Methanospirillum sp.]|uniref:ABC transporter ATP-binding protein n=1 Tax=Methanospirillum sp. TaxID=45200 RepID=UPI0023763A6D|nr:ABC transporter ATP-binding protein [Methanospirillum sp.]MDD1730123.1 ABC transporter ATP-binding protein [Methanospirillum sp.]